MNSWRKSISMTFPIQRWHPKQIQPSGATSLRTIAWLDSPPTIWGSHDGSDTYRHGGVGLSRSAGYPSREYALPGGVLDSAGLHVPILDLDAPDLPHVGIWHLFRNMQSLFRTFEYRFCFGEPEKLTLDAYKAKLVELNKKEKGMPKSWKKTEKAKSFYEVMSVDVPEAAMRAYYKRVNVKNWIDESRHFRLSQRAR